MILHAIFVFFVLFVEENKEPRMSVLDLFRLNGKTALVTGCRRGIGLALATALAQAGADIVGCDISALGPDEEVAQRVTAAGRRFIGYGCDFSDRKSLYQWITQVKAEAPPIDILMNNAGMTLRKPAAEHPDEYWDQVLEVNLTAQFILAREFGKEMLARGHGKIIFTASLMAFQGGINQPSYTASKGAVGRLAMALANEWAGRGVNVNAMAPGYIATDLNVALRNDPQRCGALMERIPAGRFGTPDDLQGIAVFLASEASNYVDGTIIPIDGGWMGR